MAFTTESSMDGDTAIVRFEGELDLATAPQAETALRELEESQQPPGRIVLDLRGVRFLDSTGLRVILAADSRARREGRHVQVIAGPEPVHRVFRIALLDRRLEFIEGDGV
jgi:anti-sigma B factor antagonist